MADLYSGLTIEDFDNGTMTDEECERLLAAEASMWGFGNAIALGLLDDLPLEHRSTLLEFMGYYDWCDLAVETGIMPKESPEVEEEYEAGPIPGFMY